MYELRNSTGNILIDTKLCEDIRTIRLRRKGNSPLGFAIRGGWEHGTGIFVSEVYSESEAEREGLKPGDQILRVNGFSIEQAIHDEVISLIKSASKIILKVKSVGMIPVKENRTEPIQWKFISDLQHSQVNKIEQQTNNVKSKQYRQQKNKSKCPIHSLKKEEGQIAKILLKNDTKLVPSKPSNLIELNSAGSSPTSSVSSKYSSSITSSSLSSCSKLIAKSCKSALSSASSSHQPTASTKGKLNGYYSRSLSNLTNLTTSADFVDGFSLTSTSTINFTRNKSTSNLNLELASSISPQQTASSTDDDSSTLEKVRTKSNKCSTIYVNLSSRESLGCSVVKGPATCPGIFIQTIKPNGVAAKAGLEVGDQIISLNDLSCLPEHMQFGEAVEKIKGSKQMKFKVKKNTAISLFLEQTLTATNKANSRKLAKKTIQTDLSSSSCNESTSPIGHASSASTNYSKRSNKNHFNSCNGSHLPYYMNKFSSRQNLNTSSSSNYLNSLKGQTSNPQSDKSSLSGSNSKRPLRKNAAHHRSYTSLLSNNSTYGQRMSGYHSPVCLRHSSSNYYSQSENDYSVYELEEQNEKKKVDLILNSDKLINGSNRGESYGYTKNSRPFKSKSIRNLNRTSTYDCDCSCLTYYPVSDCNEFDYHKKSFNFPTHGNLLKQKLLRNNLSCTNLTFKSSTDIGLSNCQQLCTLLNNQMNALQLNHLSDEVKSKSSLELNEDLILNNKLYEKMRLEKERLAVERKKLETEQLRLQEEKDKFEREKKQLESIKQHDELKCISSSSTLSNTSAAASQTIKSNTTQSIGFLDEIKKLAERRASEDALITDTLNKTRFSTGELKPVRLLPIADGKIKQLHPDDEKRKQHDALMQEFREAHQKMFGSKAGHNLKPIVLSAVGSTGVSKNQTNLEKSNADCETNESNSIEMNSSSNIDKFTCSTNGMTSSNLTTNLSSITNQQQIPIPPLLPPSIMTMTSALTTIHSNNEESKFAKKLNTFGKLVQEPDQRNLSNNVSPKNNRLNGLNQGETVKILRTSTPCKKGPAPQPPINKQTNSESSNQKSTTRIIKMNKKEEKITFLNRVNNSSYMKQNQIKPEGQMNSSPVEQTEYTSDHLVEKPNCLTRTASDFSLSSLSIKVVQVPTK